MMNTKNFAEEILNAQELENVSGGTVEELKELSNAILGNSKFKILSNTETHVPGVNRIVANTAEKMLKEDLNIDANILLGFLGTGAGSSKNTYRDMKTGQYISHAEVLDRIRKAY